MGQTQSRDFIHDFSLHEAPQGISGYVWQLLRQFMGHGDQGYSRALLQLFGYIGHGKSSFINSCKYVINEGEQFIEYATAGDREDGGAMTMVRKAYDLTQVITIVDNRGFPTMNSFERAEIYAQLGNFIPISEKVEWMDNYTDMMNRLQDAELNPNYSDFIVPVFIYGVSHMFSIEAMEEIKLFMKNCVTMTGVVPIIVLAKKTGGDFIETEKSFRLVGAETVIAMENYTEEDNVKTRRRTRDIRKVIESALMDVKFQLRQGRNPREDWVRRKTFLLDYIHKADLEKKENERIKEELDKTK